MRVPHAVFSSLVLACLVVAPLAQDPVKRPVDGPHVAGPHVAGPHVAGPHVAGPQVGKPAPAFRLNDHTGAAVRVGGKSKTWTVLAFYPKAATPG